ncbi:MAG: galactose oxidase [Gammaproteobacteria bacterium]|nr:galactose oxidase [Gammaproteobacteria bacterium]
MYYHIVLVAALTVCATLRAAELPDLPDAVTNNAVAAIALGDGVHLISAMGLRAGKTWRDTSSAAWHLAPGATQWRSLAAVPGGEGRLASTAVAVGKFIYLFGGYTVAEDHTEVSVPLVHALDPVSGFYTQRAAMPVPVDDTVALAYADRYIYLVSGWHDSGNVNLVQLYDTETDTWQQATPWPAAAVFGHAGGIVGDVMIVCDGVKVQTTRSQRKFKAAKRCLQGKIRADDYRRIDWSAVPHHPGQALYRMAATGAAIDNEPVIFFAGGSVNPYNYNGIGYDGKPSAASSALFAWFVADQRWRRLENLPVGTMDHRGLIQYNDEFVIIGGMRDQQRVSSDVLQFRP